MTQADRTAGGASVSRGNPEDGVRSEEVLGDGMTRGLPSHRGYRDSCSAMCVAAVRLQCVLGDLEEEYVLSGAIRFCSRSQRLVLDVGLPVRASARSHQRRASRSYPHHRHRHAHLPRCSHLRAVSVLYTNFID